jgi:hypothetical protein
MEVKSHGYPNRAEERDEELKTRSYRLLGAIRGMNKKMSRLVMLSTACLKEYVAARTSNMRTSNNSDAGTTSIRSTSVLYVHKIYVRIIIKYSFQIDVD